MSYTFLSFLRAVWRILFLNTFIRYHILHQNAPYFALFCEFLFFFLRKRAAMEQKERHSMNKFAFAQRINCSRIRPRLSVLPAVWNVSAIVRGKAEALMI